MEIVRRIVQKTHQHRRRQRSPTIFNVTRCASFHSKTGSGETSPPSTVVLLRHGQSLWNKIPTFTGWCDVPLTDLGIEQAEGAARLMKERGLNFDLVYSSELKRAYKSAEVVLETMNDPLSSRRIEPKKVWELNERQYVDRKAFCVFTIDNNRFCPLHSTNTPIFILNETTQLRGSTGPLEEKSRASVNVRR